MSEQPQGLQKIPLEHGERVADDIPSVPPQKEHARRESNALADFSRHAHGYICGSIQFADQKAGFLFAFVGAVLAFEFQKKMQSDWLKNPFLWSAIDLSSFLSMLSFLASQFLAASVVVPRLRSSRSGRGAVYFRAISGHGSPEEYVSSVSSLTDDQLSHVLLEHAYDLAKISDTKYSLLTAALWFAFMGTLFGIFAMLLHPLG